MTQIIQIALPPELLERLDRLEAKLDQLAPEERLWTTKDVAEYMGVTEETVRVWVRSGELEVTRAGNRMRFDPSAVKALRK